MINKYRRIIYFLLIALSFVVISRYFLFNNNDIVNTCEITDKIRYDLKTIRVNQVLKRLNYAGAMPNEINNNEVVKNCTKWANSLPADTILKKYNELLKTLNK